MKTLILSLMLVSFPSLAESAEVSLQIQYSRFGEEICSERVTVKGGEVYQFCEKDFRGKRNWLRIAAFVEKGNQVKLAMAMEELEPSGLVRILSSPKIIVNNGQKAEMTYGASKEGKYEESENIIVVPEIRL